MELWNYYFLEKQYQIFHFDNNNQKNKLTLSGNIEIKWSIFQNYKSCGVISIINSNSCLLIDHSMFEKCTNDKAGGCIFMNSSLTEVDIAVLFTCFEECSTTTNGATIALYSQNGNDKSCIEHCSVSGSSLAESDIIKVEYGITTARSINISNNSIQRVSGFSCNSCKASFSYSSFCNNIQESMVMCLYFLTAASLTNCNFAYNDQTKVSDIYFAIIHLQSQDVISSLTMCSFLGNTGSIFRQDGISTCIECYFDKDPPRSGTVNFIKSHIEAHSLDIVVPIKGQCLEGRHSHKIRNKNRPILIGTFALIRCNFEME